APDRDDLLAAGGIVAEADLAGALEEERPFDALALGVDLQEAADHGLDRGVVGVDFADQRPLLLGHVTVERERGRGERQRGGKGDEGAAEHRTAASGNGYSA